MAGAVRAWACGPWQSRDPRVPEPGGEQAGRKQASADLQVALAAPEGVMGTMAFMEKNCLKFCASQTNPIWV